jgi:hypothetical protein
MAALVEGKSELTLRKSKRSWALFSSSFLLAFVRSEVDI